MPVVDASALYEALVGTDLGASVRARLTADGSPVAPHVVDVEVLEIVRKSVLSRGVDLTAATQAVEDLRAWPGRRFGHGPLLARAWQLRDNIHGWDAM